MNMQEAIEKREALLAEERKVNQAIKILNSDSMPGCALAGIKMAIGQCNRRLHEITEEIRALANAVEVEKPEEKRVGNFHMFGENDKPATNENIKQQTTGDADLDFLINVLHRAQKVMKERNTGAEFTTLLNLFLK
jgi:hypothetical protein